MMLGRRKKSVGYFFVGVEEKFKLKDVRNIWTKFTGKKEKEENEKKKKINKKM